MTTAPQSPKAIFLEALDCESPAEIDRFLEAACNGDEQLQGRVAALLSAHQQAGRFLGGASRLQQTLLDHSGPPLGAAIGPYKLREVLGDGGMGIVYAAEQEHPIRRKVALKVIKPGMDSREVIARFEAERQALALMEHPNIARVLDAGTTEFGRPYFVMELVRGLPITDYCDRARLPLRERLELFVAVCQAVHHAHQKGIIHRDLKPSNVMITLHDGVPVPKVIDFGVAKALNQRLTEQTLYTRVAQMLGTPMYMSPEQAELSALDVDTRSDVYSLGVLLYELLTGETPFDKERFSRLGYDELRRMIRDVEPSRPSARISTLDDVRQSTLAMQRGLDPREFGPSLRGELDWIVVKSLEKDRNRRYESAAALAADVQHFLADEPVDACPPSWVYRFAKFSRRHTAALAATAAVLVTLIAGTAVSVWLAIDATNARHTADERLLAEQQAREGMQQALRDKSAALERVWAANQRVYPVDIQSAFEVLQNGKLSLAGDLLTLHLPEAGAPDRRGFEWRHLWACSHPTGVMLRGHEAPVFSLSFSPDGRLLASASSDRTARLWDVATRELKHVLSGHTNDVNCVRFSPRGDAVATASEDMTIGIWDSSTGERRLTLRGHGDMVNCLTYTPDGDLLVSGSVNGELKSWNTQTGLEVQGIYAHDGRIHAVDVSDDGTLVVTCGSDQTVRIWRLPSLEPHSVLENPEPHLVKSMQSVRFRPASQSVLAAFRSGYLRYWDIAEGQLVQEIHVNQYLLDLAFFADGDSLATTGGRSLVRRNADDLGSDATYSLNTEGNWCTAISSDGRLIAAGLGSAVTLIDTRMAPNDRRVATLDVAIEALSPAPDGRSLVIGCRDGSLRRLDMRTGDEHGRKLVQPGGVVCAEHSPDGSLLATGGDDHTVRIWDAHSLRPLRPLAGFDERVTDVAFSMDGRLLAACDGRQVKCWETGNWQVTDEFSVPSGQCLVFDNVGGILVAGESLRYRTPDRTTLEVHVESPVLDMDVAPDGQLAAMAHEALSPSLFDFNADFKSGSASTTSLRQLRSNRILAVAITRDRRTLAAVDSRGWTAFWNIPTGRKMLMLSLADLTGLPDHFDKISMSFAADDTVLVFGLTPNSHDNRTPHQGVVFALHAPPAVGPVVPSTDIDDDLQDSNAFETRFLDSRDKSSTQ